MPIDSRKDSDPTFRLETEHTRNVDLQALILKKLEELALDGHETRSSLKSLNISVDGLRGSHDDQRKSLERLAGVVLEQGQEIGRVKNIAERALENATGAKKAVSDTVSAFEATMAAVHTSQNQVAGKAEAVAKKTETIEVETVKQTKVLDTQTTTLATQTTQLASVKTLVEGVKNNLPLWLAVAGIAGSVAGELARAFFSAFHH